MYTLPAKKDFDLPTNIANTIFEPTNKAQKLQMKAKAAMMLWLIALVIVGAPTLSQNK